MAVFWVVFFYAIGEEARILGTLAGLAAFYGILLYIVPILREKYSVDVQAVEGSPRIVAMIVCAAVLISGVVPVRWTGRGQS